MLQNCFVLSRQARGQPLEPVCRLVRYNLLFILSATAGTQGKAQVLPARGRDQPHVVGPCYSAMQKTSVKKYAMYPNNHQKKTNKARKCPGGCGLSIPACGTGRFAQRCAVNPATGKWEWKEKLKDQRNKSGFIKPFFSTWHQTLASKADALNVSFLSVHQDNCL